VIAKIAEKRLIAKIQNQALEHKVWRGRGVRSDNERMMPWSRIEEKARHNKQSKKAECITNMATKPLYIIELDTSKAESSAAISGCDNIRTLYVLSIIQTEPQHTIITCDPRRTNQSYRSILLRGIHICSKTSILRN
jgi:hypothetical protein